QVFDTLKKLSQEKLVIVVSHDREFAETYGDRIIELADGKIIRDIERVKGEETEEDQGISVIDERFIRIKKGYRLTEEDRQMINAYLAKAEQDVYLSSDSAANLLIQKAANINEKGQVDTFMNTNQERLSLTIETAGTFRLIKSRLPLKNAFRIGASGLKVKKIRLVLTILLSVVAFTLFGLADTVSSYNKIDNMVQSIEDNRINYLSITKTNKVYYDGQEKYWEETETLMKKEHIEELQQKFKLPFIGVLPGASFSYQLIDYPDHYAYDSYYKGFYGGIIELSEKEITDLGFTIIGTMPSNEREIAITQYHFEHFQLFGYQSLDGEKTIAANAITSIEDFLNEKPTLSLLNDDYSITAVIDTHLNKERYKSLAEENTEWDWSWYYLNQELTNLLKYSYHALIYAGPGLLDPYLEDSATQLPLQYHEFSILIDKTNPHSDRYIVSSAMNVEDHHGKILYLGDRKALANHEFLLNIADLFDKSHGYFSPQFNYLIAQHLDQHTQDAVYQELIQAIEGYADQHLDEAIENGFADGVLDGHSRDELLYLFTSQLMDPYSLLYENPYLPNGQAGLFVLIDALIEALDRYALWDDLETIFSQFGARSEQYELLFDSSEFSVAGLFIPDPPYYQMNHDLRYSLFSLVLLPKDVFEIFDAYIGGRYAFAIAPMPSSRSDIRHIIKALEDKDVSPFYFFALYNEVSFLINNVNQLAEELAYVFLFIGIGFCVFATLLLFNFIATSISYKQRDIGILRAIGARSKDVFSIFFSESFLIAIINFLFTLLATWIIVSVINRQLRIEYGILLTFFRFGIRQVILLLFVSIGVAFFASFIPVYRTARKKPIDAIRKR
ncbi:MAG TPA: FtsX-like permease family protein, partial [Haloplasmataceae bacterium]